MFDWPAIYLRFFEAYEVKRSSELARILGITKQTAHSWKAAKSHVPWRRMRKVVQEKNIRWEWLIEGRTPKFLKHQNHTMASDFNWGAINSRFFELFPDTRQQAIADQFGVAQETVSKWYRCKMHVPWEKLKHAKVIFRVTWDWLLEGDCS